MLLSARPIDNYTNVNTYDVVSTLAFTASDGPSLYFQLVDLSKDRADQNIQPPGRRYMPASGATLQVVLDNIDDAKVTTKTAVQPSAQDPSIWRIDLMSTDPCTGTVTLKFTLTEGAVVRRFVLQNVLRVTPGL